MTEDSSNARRQTAIDGLQMVTQTAQGQTIESKGLGGLPYVSHRVRTANVGHNDGVRVSSDATGIKRDVGVTNGIRSMC